MSRLVRRVWARMSLALADLAVRTLGPTLLSRRIFSARDYPEMRRHYGDFRLDRNYSRQHLRGLAKESGTIRGVIVDVVGQLRRTRRIERALLPGEYNADKGHYARLFGIGEDRVVTAGLGGDVDFAWNFEESPPAMGDFDLVVSQAMLEHLVDPYRHLADLSRMTVPGGVLILHTHIPGFRYHRFPIDCLRFHPDWFERSAERLGLTVSHRHIGDLRICYALEKGR